MKLCVNVLILAYYVSVSAFLIFPLVERATSAKQVQVMTGLNPGQYMGHHSPLIALFRIILKFCHRLVVVNRNLLAVQPGVGLGSLPHLCAPSPRLCPPT